jgi:hypothetical protein
MTAAVRARTHDSTPARWSRHATPFVASALLAALVAMGQAEALALAEAAAWSLALAALALRLAGWSPPSLDARFGLWLTTALGLSMTVALARMVASQSGVALISPSHLPVITGGSAIRSTLRALTVGLLALSLRTMSLQARGRSAALTLVGAAMTLTAADLCGLDLLTAPLAGLAWLLAGWTCLVARELCDDPPRLEGRWRRMLAFAVLLLAGLELTFVGLRPSMTAMALVTARYGPWLLLRVGRRPRFLRLALGWSVVTGLDLVHRTVSPGRGWSLADIGAVAAAGLTVAAFGRQSATVREPSTIAA